MLLNNDVINVYSLSAQDLKSSGIPELRKTLNEFPGIPVKIKKKLGEIHGIPVGLTQHLLQDFQCRPWGREGGYFLE